MTGSGQGVPRWVGSSREQPAIPIVNSGGSIDILFGPNEPKAKSNWIKTVAGKGFFPMFRFYGPGEPFFDKTWKLKDLVEVKRFLPAAGLGPSVTRRRRMFNRSGSAWVR
jgi:hypothetical protein